MYHGNMLGQKSKGKNDGWQIDKPILFFQIFGGEGGGGGGGGKIRLKIGS